LETILPILSDALEKKDEAIAQAQYDRRSKQDEIAALQADLAAKEARVQYLTTIIGDHTMRMWNEHEARALKAEARVRAAEGLLRDIRDNYDCEEDAHRNGMADVSCRCCKAKAFLTEQPAEKPTAPKERICADCKSAPADPGVTVCTPCWDIAYADYKVKPPKPTPPSVTPDPISRCERCGKPWSVKTCPDCIRGSRPPDPPAAPPVAYEEWERMAGLVNHYRMKAWEAKRLIDRFLSYEPRYPLTYEAREWLAKGVDADDPATSEPSAEPQPVYSGPPEDWECGKRSPNALPGECGIRFNYPSSSANGGRIADRCRLKPSHIGSHGYPVGYDHRPKPADPQPVTPERHAFVPCDPGCCDMRYCADCGKPASDPSHLPAVESHRRGCSRAGR
jgi:hypothetical protein